MPRLARVILVSLVSLATFVGGGTAAGALQPYVFVTQWGTTGNGNGQFQDPSDVAVDSAGNVYVSDAALGRISKFDANGGFIKAWTRGCKICTFFDDPESLATGPGNVLWLADTGNQRLVKMDANGNELVVVPTPPAGQPGHFGSPLDVAVDNLGKVYVSGGVGDARVHIFDANGTFVVDRGTGTDVMGVGAIAVDATRTLYAETVDAGANLKIKRISSLGFIMSSFTPTGAGLGSPGLAVDTQGRLYFSSGNPSVQIFSVTGTPLGAFGSAGTGPLQFNNPEATAPNAFGILYVADRGNDRVQKVTETSTLVISVTDDVDATPYTFTVANGPTAVPSFQLDDVPGTPLPQQHAVPALVPGVYRVQITGGPNFPKEITCSNGQQVLDYGASFIDVTVLAGQTVSCSFYVEWIG